MFYYSKKIMKGLKIYSCEGPIQYREMLFIPVIAVIYFYNFETKHLANFYSNFQFKHKSWIFIKFFKNVKLSITPRKNT